MKKYISFWYLILIIIFAGCSIFEFQHEKKPVVDEFAIKYKQWQKYVTAGNQAIQNDELDKALNAYQQAIAIKPQSSEIHIKIGQIYFRQEEYEKAIESFKTGLQYEPSNNDARNYLGYIYEQKGEEEKAALEYETVLKYDPNDLYALNHLGLMYIKLGKLDQAEVLLRRALEIDADSSSPNNKDVHNYLGLIYEERGNIWQAITEYRESIRLNPDEIWARQHLGSLFEDHGRYYEAQLIYLELLKIDPDNLFAASRLETLEKLTYPQSLTEIKPVEIIDDNIEEIISSSPSSKQYPDDDAIILLDKFSHEVLEDGSSRYTTHQIIKILTERGIKKYGDIAIAFHSQSQNIGVNIARTILPDGTVIEPSDEAYNDVTPPGLVEYNLFSDLMWKVIAMPALIPGVIIEYKVTVEDALIQDQNVEISETWFWGDMSFQSTDPTLRSKCALRIPTYMQFKWKAYNCQIKPEISMDEQSSIYVWDYGESDGLEVEPNMPCLKEIIPRLSYSSVNSWQEVHQWYQNLAKGQYDVDEIIENKVRELTSGIKDKEIQIKSIYNFVAQKIRYVGIELGQGAYQPSAAIQVFKHRYGDCKDKVTLLIAMLKLAGIKAYPAMINPKPYAKVNIDLPSPNQFAHLICAVPKKQNGILINKLDSDYLWLDPTVETCGYRTLPYRVQGRQAFVMPEDKDGFFVTTPTDLSDANRLKISIQMRLDKNGRMNGVEKITTIGQFSIDYRYIYKEIKPVDLKNFFQTALNQKYPGLKIHDVSLSGLDELDVPFLTTVIFSVENYYWDSDDKFIIPIPSDELSEQATLVAQQKREYALETGYPMQIQKHVKLILPDGYVFSNSYQPVEMNFDFGNFVRKFTFNGKEANYDLEYTIETSSITPSKYHLFKDFIETISREDEIQLVYTKPLKMRFKN